MDFAISNTSQYNRYFTENTTMTLAQAGVYTGPDGIAEYVNFALDHSPYVAVWKSLASISTLKSFDTATGTCRFISMGASFYMLNPQFAVPGTAPFNVGVAYTLDYTPATNKINQMVVYYDIPMLEHFFKALDTKATRTFVCETMQNNCSSTWALNNLTSVAQCESKFASISQLTSDTTGHFDGNTRACRILHGVFASQNTDHCPHISFTPQQDVHGKTKCQTSANLSPGVGTFDGVDLVNFAGFKVAAAMDPSKGWATVALPAAPTGAPTAAPSAAPPASSSSGKGILPLIVLAVVALVMVGVGVIVGRYCCAPAVQKGGELAHYDANSPSNEDNSGL